MLAATPLDAFRSTSTAPSNHQIPLNRPRQASPPPQTESATANLARRLLALLAQHPSGVPTSRIRKDFPEGRRIYDALGVLEGLGAVSRENGDWFATRRGRALARAGSGGGELHGELARLDEIHGKLVEANRGLLNDETTRGLLYVTYRDVSRVLPGKKVLAVRAPGGSVVGIPEGDGWEMSLMTRDEGEGVEVVEIVGRR